jgi:hypothetical protein
MFGGLFRLFLLSKLFGGGDGGPRRRGCGGLGCLGVVFVILIVLLIIWFFGGGGGYTDF